MCRLDHAGCPVKVRIVGAGSLLFFRVFRVFRGLHLYFLAVFPGEGKGIPAVIHEGCPHAVFRYPASSPYVYLFVFEIQGHNMVGIDILCSFFAVEAAGSDREVVAICDHFLFFLFCQLKHKIRWKESSVTFYLFIQSSGGYPVKFRQIRINDYL